MRLRIILVVLSTLGLSACQNGALRPDALFDAPLPESPIPEGCSNRGPATTPKLQLPRTEAPISRKGTDPSVDLAQVHTVNKALQDAGVWTDFNDGWSLLALELRSEGARSLAVRLRETQLPRKSEVWLCSSDKRVRQGPYREATDGDLWTPVIPGNTALVQVWLPTTLKEQFKAQLADVYGGYR